MNRKIIPNIPDIGFYGNETDYGVNLFAAVFGIVGEKMERAELAFYIGMANHFAWIEGDWVGSRGCECFGNTGVTPFEEELRFLKTMGWSAKHLSIPRGADGKTQNIAREQIRRDFAWSIDKGYPILTRHAESHRYAIAIGYEDGGEKIVCVEAVDGDLESGNHEACTETFVHADWLDTIQDCIILQGRLEPVPERERVLEQLKHITARACRADKISK